MKVYLEPFPGLSRAMKRVSYALGRYSPLPVTMQESDADLVVLHVIGSTNLQKKIAELKANGQRYIVIQYCLRTTENPNTAFWIPIWNEAVLVWSYYDLWIEVTRDGHQTEMPQNFYLSPLGVDSKVFCPTLLTAKDFTILTSGYVAATESVYEAIEASKGLGKHFHLGPQLSLERHVTSALGISDQVLAMIYNRCRYVAGLRRVEGFELPAAEGLLCGARPIVFDAPHYRLWFGDFAEYINEGDYDTVRDQLRHLFEGEYRAVTPTEIREAKSRFDWSPICSGFWNRVKNYVGVANAS